ncbi:MAG TPA: hypothetical protein PKC95_00135 [Thauera aminoaromatica]|nr:hypothetical protein [Thauera aminoaromatica]
MQEKIDRHEVLISDLRVVIARLDERTKTILEKLVAAEQSRNEIERRLAPASLEPLAENVSRWKGALAVIALIAGALGASITLFMKRVLLNL